MTPKICSYADSGLRRFTLPEGRNLNQENVRAWLAWWHQQYARMETTPRELEQVPGFGLLWGYEQVEPCGAYDAMDRAISSLTYRSPTGPEDPA